jgi:4a-hydroxytetrahydrobiopterin dehydratase
MSSASDLPPGWRVAEGHHLEKEFRFPDFAQALAFVNAVGAAAEELGHHPDLELGWGRVLVKTWTHDASAITEKDHALAARIEALRR